MPRLGQFISNNIGAARQRQQVANPPRQGGGAVGAPHGPMEHHAAQLDPRHVQQNVQIRANQGGNPQLSSPDVDPPTRAAKDYASSLEARQFHKEVFNKSIDDTLRRNNLGKQTKAMMKAVNKHHVKTRVGLGHRIKAFFLLRWSDTVFPRASSSRYDNFFGSKSAGNQGLQDSSRGLQVSHLEELKLHRGRRGLLRDLHNHSLDRNVTDRYRLRSGVDKQIDRTRARLMTRKLQTVLNLQKRELQSIKQGRALTPEESAFEARLDAEITRLDHYDKKFDRPLQNARTHEYTDTQALYKGLNALFNAEPASLGGISSNAKLSQAAQQITAQSRFENTGVSKGNVLQLASDKNLIGFSLDSKKGVTDLMLLEQDQRNAWHDREEVTALKLRRSPGGADLSSRQLTDQTRRLVLSEKQGAVADVLKQVEKNGLMPQFEANLQQYANQRKVAGGENETFQYQKQDGTNLNLCVRDFKKVMGDWSKDHAAFRENHKAMHRGFWARLGHRIASVFDTSGHGAAASKGAVGGMEAAAGVIENEVALAEDGGVDHHDGGGLEDPKGGVKEIEKDVESLEHKLHDIESATGIVDEAEHGFAMIKAGRGVYKTKKEIDAINQKKALAETNKADYERERDATNTDHERLKFEYRNKVKYRHCQHMSEESLAKEWTELGIHGGKFVRHGLQATGKGLQVAHAAAHGVKLIGQTGLALAVLVEAVETGVDIHTAHKARMSAKQVKQGAKKFENKILDKHEAYMAGPKPSIEALEKGLKRLEKSYSDNAALLNAPADDDLPFPDGFDQTVRENMAVQAKAIASIRQDLHTLSEVKAIAAAMVDKKNVGTKIATATGSALATAGYGTALVGTVVAGGFLVIAPVGAAIVGTTALALGAYKTHKSGQRKWAASRSLDAIVGQADPKIVARLKKEARELGISPQLHAFNYLAKEDPRWLAAITHAQLKSETAKHRLTDEDIQNRAGMDSVQRGQADERQKSNLYNVSPVVRQLHDVHGMSMDAIASIVNADNTEELNRYGAELVKQHIDKE